MNIVTVTPIVAGVQAALVTAGLAVGVGVKPETIPANAGWLVIYAFTPTESPDDGSMAEPYEQDPAEMQLVFVGRTPDQATWVADRARAVLLPGAFTVAGRALVKVSEVAGRQLQRDDDQQPPLYSIAANFQIRTTPA
jgi:hypothetical protein